MKREHDVISLFVAIFSLCSAIAWFVVGCYLLGQ